MKMYYSQKNKDGKLSLTLFSVGDYFTDFLSKTTFFPCGKL